MNYKELQQLCAGKSFPVAGKNDIGENLTITPGRQLMIRGGIQLIRPYFDLATAQHNGWMRHNFIYEDGSTEEFYCK
jgi:hypothetical protein